MWLFRIINSFLEIRKKNDLSKDLKDISLFKVIVLFLTLNIIFIGIVFFITRLFITNG